MKTKLIVLSIFTVLYFVASQWLYSNHVAGVCCGAEQSIAAASATPAAAASLPLAYNWKDATPVMDGTFDDYKKNQILNGMTEDNILQISGHYHQGETAPEGFDNMGLARAAALRDLMANDIPLERIDISANLVPDHSTMENAPFAGASFNWMAAPEKGETTIIEVENKVTIYFPFNSTVKDQNSTVDDYLSKLAERLKQTTEKVSITGHTDDVGEDEANEKLGLQRAQSIQNILNGLGIEKDRILIYSKGERQPATANDSEQGRHRNRRTVLNIIQ